MDPTYVVLGGQLRPDGTLELDDKPRLPPGRVRVTVETATSAPAPPAPARTLAERFQGVIGIISDLPADMAENHDHYIHGTPK